MKATIVVEYGKSVALAGNGLVVVELDGNANRDSEDKETSQFFPGDEPVFLVHHDSSIRIDRIAATSGMVAPMGIVSRPRNQRQLFTQAATVHDLPHNPAGGVSSFWFGKQGSGFTVAGRSLSVQGNIPCLADLTYSVSFKQYRLIPPPLTLAEEEQYPIAIVIYVEAAA